MPVPGHSLYKAKPLPPSAFPRVPTGVSDFDATTGGLPPGSVVLFMGEAGSGFVEFALTSAARITKALEDSSEVFYMGLYHGGKVLPTHITYLSFTKSRDELLGEVRNTFSEHYPMLLSRHMVYCDLSGPYFSDSMVPPEWSRAKRPLLDGEGSQPREVLSTMAGELENHGKNSLVIVDSLSDLLVRSSIRKEDVVTLVKGLRRRAKDWKGTVYLLLSKSITEPWIEEAIKDSVDAVLQFGWVSNPHKSSRLRAMWIEKSMPLLAYMRPEQQGRFIINVNETKGLVTTQYERID
jgi:archaellum biogenesis ATPase FlaH